MAACPIQALDQFVLPKIFVSPVTLLHLDGQINRFKGREAAKTSQALAPASDSIGFSRIAGIGHFGFFVITKRAAQR
jgi:hypothetical protein